MTDLNAAVDLHLDGYCEPDPARRRELLGAAWAANGVLFDPPFEGEGVDAIAGLVDIVFEHFPDHRFRRTSDIDSHHDRFRYSWDLVAPDGTVSVSGTDVGRIDGDGRLAEITGFFGELPARAA